MCYYPPMNITTLKKNFSLILGITIPIVMVVAVAASVYLPGMFTKPTYNFAYALGGDVYGKQKFVVQDGRVVEREVKPPIVPEYYPQTEEKLYFYDVKTDESRTMSVEEAQKLHLNADIKSRDGFEVTTGGNGGFSFFGASQDYNARYLKGNGVSKKLKINLDQRGYMGGFRFLGWVE